MKSLNHFKIRIAATLFACAFVMLFAICVSPHVGASGEAHVKEAAPEDGIPCCNTFVSFLFNRNQVLTSTGRAGVFRSDNRGERWQRSMDGLIATNGVSLQPTHICQSPSQPRILYALAGVGEDVSPFNGLFFSDDFGVTWSRRGTVSTGLGTNKCAVDASDPYTVYISGFDETSFASAAWKTTDGGQTINPLTNLPACSGGDVTQIESAPGTIYLRGDDLVSVCISASTDSGNTFHPLALPNAAGIGALTVSPNGHALFLNTSDANHQPAGAVRSTDGGASWVPVNGLANGYYNFLAFDPTNSNRVYASDGLLRVSNDGGLTFTLLPASNDSRLLGGIGEIAVDQRGSVYMKTLAGPFRTDDGGRTFRSVNREFRASSVSDLAFDASGNLLVGVTHTQLLFRQTHDLDFQPIGTPLMDPSGFTNELAAVAASPTNPNIVLVAMDQRGLYRTENGGQSWTSPTLTDGPTAFVRARMAFPTTSRVYLVSRVPSSSKPGLYRSDDAGRTFARLSSLRLGAIGVDPTNADTIYVGTYSTSQGLFKSNDGGLTLQNLSQPGFYNAIAVDRRNSQIVYAGELFGQLIRSTDGGQTFAPASTGLAGEGVNGIAQDSAGTLFVWMQGGGLLSSRDNASSWQPVNAGEAFERSWIEAGRPSFVVDLRHPGRLYLGNKGVIQVDAHP